ncbi:MAG: DNA polymerase/3'-5' exonuclease PolX [Thermodesulfobacteriota bacterium]
MPIHNSDVADIFSKVADLLDIEGANQFRVRAYRTAARIVSSLPHRVSDMVKEGKDLSKIPGIGKDLSGKIKEIVETGTLEQLEEIQSRTSSELSQLMKVESLGPKRVKVLHEELGITNLEELKEAASQGKIKELEGFGHKTEESILQELQTADLEKKRVKLVEAEENARTLVDYLKDRKDVKDIVVAGSYRRKKETVGDLDILITAKKDSSVMDRFVAFEDVTKIVSKGKTRSTVLLRSGLQVDLRVVPQVSYGAALHYFTGSKDHNIAVRKLGVKRKLKINEYGVFKGDKRVAGRTEKEVYAKVDLPYIEPELRENRGEVEAAQQGKLPTLIKLEDIRGDLHAHTKETDGHHSLEELAEAGKDHGYEYIAISDHSKRVTMAHGLDSKRLAKQIEEIERLNGKLKGIVLLKSIEVDILKDGSLDLPDDILKELDLTVCSVHYDTKLSREKQTERIIKAMDNPYFTILAHPTGRLINERGPYEVDLEKVMKEAKERGCFLELNAHPDRLDLSDGDSKMAKEMGLKLAVSTDTHRITDLEYMRFGVNQGRRGWLEPKDVINTLSLKELKKLLGERKR